MGTVFCVRTRGQEVLENRGRVRQIILIRISTPVVLFILLVISSSMGMSVVCVSRRPMKSDDGAGYASAKNRLRGNGVRRKMDGVDSHGYKTSLVSRRYDGDGPLMKRLLPHIERGGAADATSLDYERTQPIPDVRPG